MQYWSVAGNPVTSVQRIATFAVTDAAFAHRVGNTKHRRHTGCESFTTGRVGHQRTVTYVKKHRSVNGRPNLVVTDPNGLNFTSATVSFANWQAGDRVQFTNTYSLQNTFVEDLVAHTCQLDSERCDFRSELSDDAAFCSIIRRRQSGDIGSAIVTIA